MNEEVASLEIRVHLCDATVETYLVEDRQEALRIIEHINPGKVFEPHLVVIGSKHSLTALQTDHITRMELITDIVPSWPFHHNVRAIREVSHGIFTACLEEHIKFPVPLGGVYQGFSEIHLTSGETLYMLLDVNADPAIAPLTSLDQHVFLQQMFNSYGMHARRHDKGVVLINPAHIARMSMHPGPSSIPPGAWHAKKSSG